MRKLVILTIMLMITVAAFGATKTIYEIQHTTNASGASPLADSIVTTQGIVTGVGYVGSRYIIAEDSGLWKSIYVTDSNHTPALGDKVTITGKVAEVTSVTEINNVTAYTLVSSGNTLPAATAVTPSQFVYPNGEEYEAVLVKLSNVRVSGTPANGSFPVTDPANPSAQLVIKDGFFPQPYNWSGVVINQVWTEIVGIVSQAGSFKVNPRSDADMIPLADINAISVKINDVEAKKGGTTAVSIVVSKLEADWALTDYTIKLGFDKRIVEFVDADISSTLSTDMPEIDLSASEDSVTVRYTGSSVLSSTTNNAVLVKLLFHTKYYGESLLNLTQASFTDTANVTINAALLSDGKIKIPIKKRISWLNIYNIKNQKNIFNPWLQEKLTIEYGSLITVGAVSCKAIIRIYDVQGRLVATLVNKNMDDANQYGISTYIWDGKDRNRTLLPIGVYYCHLEIIDRVKGDSETTIQPIVVAAELK